MQNIHREPLICTQFTKQNVCPFLYLRDVYTFPKQALVFTCPQYKSFENTAGKGEIARNEQFLLFPQCFLTIWKTFCHFCLILNCRLQTVSVSKIRRLGKG